MNGKTKKRCTFSGLARLIKKVLGRSATLMYNSIDTGFATCLPGEKISFNTQSRLEAIMLKCNRTNRLLLVLRFAMLAMLASALPCQRVLAQDDPPPQPSPPFIDESRSLFNGSAIYSIPIVVAPGTHGMQPNLALTYNSQAAWGRLGWGWSISGLDVIQRCVRKGAPRYEGNDVFQWRGEELIYSDPATSGDGYYHPQRENFARIENFNASGSGSYWLVTEKNGTKFRFGYNSDSRIDAVFADPADPRTGEVRRWALDRVEDSNGNYMTITYLEDPAGAGNGDYYPDTVTYTMNGAGGIGAFRTVKFNWESRTDERESWSEGARERIVKRLASVEVKVGANLLRKYVLTYANGSIEQSMLTQVQEFGSDEISTLPPTVMTYQDIPGGFGPEENWGEGFSWENHISYSYRDTTHQLIDINGDGLPDDVYRYKYLGSNPQPHQDGTYRVRLNTGSGFGPEQNWGEGFSWAQSISYTYNGQTSHQLIDVNGDGLPDNVWRIKYGSYSPPHKWDGRYHVQLNTGSGFGPEQDWGEGFSWDNYIGNGNYGKTHQLVDMNGDGLPDDVWRYKNGSYSPPHQYDGHYHVRLNTGNGFGPEKDWGEGFSWENHISYTYRNTTHQLIDINGDGLPDDVYRYTVGSQSQNRRQLPCETKHR